MQQCIHSSNVPPTTSFILYICRTLNQKVKICFVVHVGIFCFCAVKFEGWVSLIDLSCNECYVSDDDL